MNKAFSQILGLVLFLGVASAHRDDFYRNGTGWNATGDLTFPCVNATDNSTYNCSGSDWRNSSGYYEHSNRSHLCVNKTDNSTYNCSRSDWDDFYKNGSRPHKYGYDDDSSKKGRSGSDSRKGKQSRPESAKSKSSDSSSSSQSSKSHSPKASGLGYSKSDDDSSQSKKSKSTSQMQNQPVTAAVGAKSSGGSSSRFPQAPKNSKKSGGRKLLSVQPGSADKTQ